MPGAAFKDIFKWKASKLEGKLNVDEGLLSKLEEYKIITDFQRHKIKVFMLIFASISTITGINFSAVSHG